MPEHRPGTPSAFEALESFLWWDFRDCDDWAAWARKWRLASSKSSAVASYDLAVAAQALLRRLELVNNGAKPDGSAIERLNEFIRELDIRPQLSPSGKIALASKARPAARPVAAMLILALQAMTDGIWNRFKLCRDPSCSASFYDASKSATKIWCSMAICGSRNKMRRLRRRRRS
jgi:predicted RNA-binding Zn ribbon-like protein